MEARTKPRHATLLILLLVGLLTTPAAVRADIQVTLKDGFITEYKDRVTIDAQFTVDKALRTPSKPGEGTADGDLHAAGRDPRIGLPIVAEIMNAKMQPDAVQLIHRGEQTKQPLNITGVWRLWCEHGGDSVQVQGQDYEPFTTTNPPHVFEIHPITQINGTSCLETFRKIPGYRYKNAEEAFRDYERTKFEITHDAEGKTTTLHTQMAGYNYVAFVMELNEKPMSVADGAFVKADVYTLDGELLVHDRRMVFVKGTAPADRLQSLKTGDRLTVVGLPRIDLALVQWRLAHAKERPGALRWGLPYEMVIVSVDAPQ